MGAMTVTRWEDCGARTFGEDRGDSLEVTFGYSPAGESPGTPLRPRGLRGRSFPQGEPLEGTLAQFARKNTGRGDEREGPGLPVEEPP